jgi:hypothetical protein
MIITMFVLSSVYWIISIFETFIIIDMWRSRFDPVSRQLPKWLLMTFVIPMVNVSVHYMSCSHIIIHEHP